MDSRAVWVCCYLRGRNQIWATCARRQPVHVKFILIAVMTTMVITRTASMATSPFSQALPVGFHKRRCKKRTLRAVRVQRMQVAGLVERDMRIFPNAGLSR